MPDFNLERFKEILDDAGVSGPVRRTGQSLLFVCPMCGSEALKLYRRTGNFTCFHCRTVNGMHGSAVLFLARALGINLGAARGLLYGRDGAPLRSRLAMPQWTADEDEDEEAAIPTSVWSYHHHPIESKAAERGAAYLEGRGIPVSVAKEYGIRYSTEDRRVCFPITLDGRLVGWQGRLIIPHEGVNAAGEKYVGIKALTELPDGVRDRVLMFQDRIVPGGHAVLGEGPVGAVKGHLCGGNVASMGKVVSSKQLAILRREGIRTLYLALDPDAVEEAMRIVRSEAGYMEIRLMEIPPDKEDTGAMTFEENYDIFRSARIIKPWTILHYWGKKRRVA